MALVSREMVRGLCENKKLQLTQKILPYQTSKTIIVCTKDDGQQRSTLILISDTHTFVNAAPLSFARANAAS